MEDRIIDTCVVSYLLKKHSLAEQYRPLLKDKLLSQVGWATSFCCPPNPPIDFLLLF